MKRKSTENNLNSEAKVAKKEQEKPEFHYSDNKKSLYRPPTSEELNSLKETEDLFHSSLLHMQINELLAEVCLRKKKKKLDNVLCSLHELIMSLPDGDQQDLSDISWLPGNVCFPLPPLPGPMKGKFTFQKPESVNVVGSYQLGTLCKQEMNVDVAVQLPKGLVHSKDFLNLRYHYKRAVYLTILASAIKKSKICKSINFAYHNENMWTPILLLKPEGLLGEKVTVKLFVTLAKDSFKLARFSPTVNNIQYSWYFGDDTSVLETLESIPSTPHYNAAILADMLMEQHLQFLHGKITKHQAFCDAVILCKIWLHQRHLDKGVQAFSSFHCAMILAYLLQTRKINQHMSSYQIIRIFWQFLGTKHLCTNGVTMLDKTRTADKRMPSLKDFHENFEVVFVGPSGVLNLLANMSKTAFTLLQSESKRALDILQNDSLDCFELLFMRSIPLVTRFDEFFRLEKCEVLHEIVKKKKLNAQMLNFAGDWLRVSIAWLERLLMKSLGRRVHTLYVWPYSFSRWSIKEKPPTGSECKVMIGYHFDADSAHTVLEKGPSADSSEACAFREFWGEKSELRRFQDGTITEAIVWECKNAREKRKICQSIVKYILQRHGGIENSHLHFTSNGFDDLLIQNIKLISSNQKTRQLLESSSGEETGQAVIRSYESLAKLLRSLDLPLSFHTIQSLSPVLRGTEVFPALPTSVDTKTTLTGKRIEKCPKWCPSNEVLIQFETSGEWPDDIEAIQRIKAAFLLNIANLLKKDHQVPTNATTKHVDVLKDGYVFRLRIAHYREMVLLKNTKVGGVKWSLMEKASDELERLLVKLPLLSNVIHGSPVTGFVRFLHLLSTFDWKNNVMIVNFNDELKVADIQEIRSHFMSNRQKLPALVIATPKDKFSSYWTKDCPSVLVHHRIVALAKESYSVYETQQLKTKDDSIDVKILFRPSFEEFDVVIILHDQWNPRRHQAVDLGRSCSYQYQPTSMSLPIVNFDPIQCYMNELKESFSMWQCSFETTMVGKRLEWSGN
ncbi:nucleolar protein 6-like isoform X2 [Xenia sp. Carnegie-2017]|uniref:nucleolar protein 6-like isoform X2 n=1 Tax=Xenia sp. Carnegie-2017 TaxID=2897299 RepID=UPI001F04F283|nr:nucleolar protein 6-like isoform X2 [Xenia sp. Carnegie-2017]